MEILILILIFLLLSAFFSGSEIAFISANKLGIAVKKAENTRRGNIINRFYERPQVFLSTMLVGNNIALVALTTLATILLEAFFSPLIGTGLFPLLAYTLIITIVVLIFGEFLPKTFFRLHSTKLLFSLAYPLSIFKFLLMVPTYIMSGLTNFILKNIFRFKIDNAESVLTKLDLEHYIEDSLSDDHDDIDKEILTNALNLGQSDVSHCMIPRTEIISVDVNNSIDELLTVVLDSKHSRIIVTDGDPDNIIGYVHHQQLWENPKTIKSILLDILYVPNVMNLKDLMMQFINNGSSIACVVDEFGGTDGIITLEDILEEIFGNIEDEHDVEDYVMQKINDTEYLLSGRLEIDYIHEKFPELELPEGDYQTLSGYIVMTSEIIPEAGQELKLNNYLFTIEEVDETKIEVVKIKILPRNQDEILTQTF